MNNPFLVEWSKHPRLKRRRELLPLLRSKGTPFRGSTYKTKPSLDSVRKHRESIRQYLLKNASGTPIEKIIQELSFKIKGWTNYFCTSNATQTFSNTDAWLFKRLFKWATKRCKGNRRKAFALYFSEVGGVVNGILDTSLLMGNLCILEDMMRRQY